MRITTYRIAIIAAGGGLAIIAEANGWRVAFLCAGVISAVAILPTFLIGESPRQRTEESLVTGLRGWLARPQAITILAIAMLYKIGDSALAPMVKPFWVDAGYSIGEIGTATTVIGISFTILGGIVGGIYLTKVGLLRSLLHLGVLQMASNAGYAIAALAGAHRSLMYTAAVFESFAGGLGTAAFLSFLMTVCEKKRAATEFALLTALYGLSRTIAGSVSGFGAELLHYGPYFTVTLALGIPGLIIVFMNRAWINDADSGAVAPTEA
jgi:PAT family beta-lactamase induction signal transducer AmpG